MSNSLTGRYADDSGRNVIADGILYGLIQKQCSNGFASGKPGQADYPFDVLASSMRLSVRARKGLRRGEQGVRFFQSNPKTVRDVCHDWLIGIRNIGDLTVSEILAERDRILSGDLP